MKTDIDFLPSHNKKKHFKDKEVRSKGKRKNSVSEDSSVEKEEEVIIEKSKTAKSFIRSAKNKRQKILEHGSVDPIATKSEEGPLFSEFANNEDTSIFHTKKQKTKKKLKQNSLTASVKTEEQVSSSGSGIDLEKIKLESMRDLPCTLFVGNLPVSVNRKMLHKLFVSFGQIKSVRLRGSVPTKMNIPRKVAEIKSEYHKGLQSHTGFVVFKEEESAKKALSLNGTLVDNHHIVVDFANQAGEKKLYDNSLSVFIGNLPFDVDDETVRSAFEECGEIHRIRVVRDKNTGLGKGFGYIQFQKIASKGKALALHDLEINGRNIRIKPIENDQSKKMGPKKSLMMIRNNMAARKRIKESGNKKSVKKLLKKGKLVHQKKKIARLLKEKFVK